MSSSFVGLSGPTYNEDGDENPELSTELRKTLVTSLEETARYYKEDSYSRELIDSWALNVENQLTSFRYKRANLFWLVGSICTLLGSMFMWFLRRIGFHFYLSGTLVIILSTFVIFGFGFTGWMFSLVHIVVGGVFTILYAINLKHLN